MNKMKRFSFLKCYWWKRYSFFCWSSSLCKHVMFIFLMLFVWHMWSRFLSIQFQNLQFHRRRIHEKSFRLSEVFYAVCTWLHVAQKTTAWTMDEVSEIW